MNLPAVHIVILNWNGLDDTLECLASIDKLTYPNVRTIVVDNASRDNQAEAIERAFPNCTVLKQTENLGFCGGCNVGMMYALEHGAGFVMLLNNDTLVPPDLIEKLLAGLDSLENVAAVSPVILEHPDENKIWFSRARWDEPHAQFRLSSPEDKYEEVRNLEPYVSDFACGCCMLIPAEVLRKQGLLDERYFAFYDEAEWCARARQNGFESYVIPSAVMYHKVSKSTPALVSTYLLARNRLLWMKENLPLGRRMKSFGYLAKELIWHRLNLLGVTNEHYSKRHSRAVVQGFRDYFGRRFGKWSAQTEAVIFPREK